MLTMTADNAATQVLRSTLHCAAQHAVSNRPVRRSNRRAQSDVEDGARGARLERRRRHQMGVARAFPQLEGRPYPGNREGGSHKVTGRGVLLTCGRHGGPQWATWGKFPIQNFQISISTIPT